MPSPGPVAMPQQLLLFDEVPLLSAAGAAAASTAPSPTLPTPAASAPAAPQPQAAAPGASAAPPAPIRHPGANRELLLAGHPVPYALRRSRRRSIGFLIGPEGLSVSAPRWVGQADIDAALRAKATWIVRKLQEQLERQRRLAAARIDWRDGTSIPFLGEAAIVVLDPRITGAVLNSSAVALPGVPRLTLHLGLPQTAAPERIRDAVQSWLQRQARRIFIERCQTIAPRLGVTMRRLSLSSAATRWGSASADGSIRLHWRLVHFALPVIDYVVTHELAHLREMNHSPAFWDVVRQVLPDYESARGTLKSEVLPVFD
jgi:predicted metal-dependent hydrolase